MTTSAVDVTFLINFGIVSVVVLVVLITGLETLMAVQFLKAYMHRKKGPTIFSGRVERVMSYVLGGVVIGDGGFLLALVVILRDELGITLAIGIMALGALLVGLGIRLRGIRRLVNVDVAAFLPAVQDYFGRLGILATVTELKQRRMWIARKFRATLTDPQVSVKITLNPRGTVVMDAGWRSKQSTRQLLQAFAGQAARQLPVSPNQAYSRFLLFGGILYLCLAVTWVIGAILLIQKWVFITYR